MRRNETYVKIKKDEKKQDEKETNMEQKRKKKIRRKKTTRKQRTRTRKKSKKKCGKMSMRKKGDQVDEFVGEISRFNFFNEEYKHSKYFYDNFLSIIS